MKMAVQAVGPQQQALALDDPASPEDEQVQAELIAGFAAVMGNIGMSMIMQQMSFTKQTIDQAIHEE
jgi:hypothetical protein